MSERTWEVGDKALCVASGDHSRAGVIYTVIAVTEPGETDPWGFLNFIGETILEMAELPNGVGVGCSADRFRKLRPDRHEGEREDWELLLGSVKRDKVRVDAED